MFTNENELVGIRTPMELKYMKSLRFSLRVLSAWPQGELGEKRSRYSKFLKFFFLIQGGMCLSPSLIYVQRNLSRLSFFQLGHMYITVLMNIVAMSRYLLPLSDKYRKVFKSFLLELHLFHHKDKSDYAMKMHVFIHKLSHFFTMYITAMMLMGIVLFNAIPLYNNFRTGVFSSDPPPNSTYEHAVYYALPYDSERNFNAYMVVFLFNWYISYLCSSCFCIYDLVLSLMVFHLWGHLKILKQSLESFPKPKHRAGEVSLIQFGGQILNESYMYSEDESIEMRKLIVENILHHRFILRFSDAMTDNFGPMLLVYFGFHQVSGCLLLLECSQMDPEALARYLPLTIILFGQLIQLSIIFELIGAQSEKLIDAVYEVPWQCMDKSNRFLVLLFLIKVQTPIRLKALGIADIGVRVMASIIKTSLSYFAFLRTVSV